MYFFGSQLRFSWKCEGKASWQPWQCRARVQRSSRFNHSNLLCFWRLMPRDPKGPKGPKDQTSKKSKSEEQAEMAVLRAQLELARAERARADEKIRRLERQLLGEAGASKSSKSSKSPESPAETSDSSCGAEASDASHSQAESDETPKSPSKSPRNAGVDWGEMFLDMLMEGIGDGFPGSIRQSAQEALRDGPQQRHDNHWTGSTGCNWIGGIRLAWTSPPTVQEVQRHVQEHFPRPIQPGDSLSKVDGKSVKGLSRQDILGLLRKFKGSIGFKRGSHDMAIRESAKHALKKGPEKDAEHSEGQNWIWGFLFAWTSPPVVREVQPEVQQHFPNPVNPGDVLHQVDNKLVGKLSRKEILKLLVKYKGSIGFQSRHGDDYRKSAQDALQHGPQEDAESGKGCDWIGGILLAWTSPPVVRDVKPEVQKRFPRPISPGDILRQIDGKHVRGLNREQILRLLQDFKGSIGFRNGSDMDEDVRKSAQDALQHGPREDAESDKGCDWIGGILLAWTSPPVVRDVKPEVQKHFPRPISPGDVLNSVDGEQVGHKSRDEILRAFVHFDGQLGFCSKHATEIGLTDLLRRLGDL